MFRRQAWVILAGLGWVWGSVVALGNASGGKEGFTLFNPTPRDQMREMNTDRPDTTESPITVDAGHFQFELSLVEYGYDDPGGASGAETSRWAVLPSNVKVGLLNNVDVQFVFTPYERVRVRTGEGRDVAEGFSDDTQIRLKMNFWGNDGPDERFGETALGLMPFVKFPTGSDELSNDHVEGGIIVPFSMELPWGWGLGLMAEVDFVYDEGHGGRYGVEYVHTATLGHDVPGVEGLGFYLEYVGIAPDRSGSTYQAIGSTGVTYQINPDWMVDFGGRFGISEGAEDVAVFVGTSFRF